MRSSRIRRLAALLAGLLLTVPALACAEGEFEAGTMLPILLAENYEGGQQIVLTATLEGGEGLALLGLDEAAIPIAQQALASVGLQICAVDNFDEQIIDLALTVSGTPVLTGTLVLRDGAVLLETNLLPGKTLVLPAQLAQGGALLAGDIWENQDVMTLLFQYTDYFYAVGNWVSQTQFDTELLYVQTYLEDSEDTETRDALAMEQSSHVMPEDFKRMMRSVADTFYSDELSQEAIANLLAPLGVTRAHVRAFADELPLFIARLQPTENATEFVYAYDYDMAVAGFDGVMPAMYDRFFFETGTLHYDRRTELEGRHYRAQGTMDFGAGAGLQGRLDIFAGDLFDDEQTAYGEIVLDTQVPAEGLAATVTFNGAHRIAIEGAQDVRTEQLTVTVVGTRNDRLLLFTGELALQMATVPLEAGDVQTQLTVQALAQDALVLGGAVTLFSRAYVPADAQPDNEIIDLNTLDAEGLAALRSEVRANLVSVGLDALILMPEQVLQEGMTVLQQLRIPTLSSLARMLYAEEDAQ